MGSIEDLYARPSNAGTGLRWSAAPWIAATEPGKRGRRGPTKAFATYRQAERYIAAVECGDTAALAELGVSVEPQRRPGAVPFATYANAWAASKPGEWATRRTYASHARSLAAHWATETLDEIDEMAVSRYFAGLTLTPSTLNCRLVVLRQILGVAARSGLIKDNPAERVRAPKLSRTPRMREISEEEAARAAAALPEWLAPALYLSYDSGLRAGEVCGLEWWAVDLTRKLITVGPVVQANGKPKGHPKNGDAMTVPLTDRAAAALAEHRLRYPGTHQDRVFREPRNGRLIQCTPDRIKNLWRPVRVAAALDPTCRWHDLRHGCATRLARAGVPPHVLQALMRHHSLSSTQVYVPAVSAEEMRAAQGAGAGTVQSIADAAAALTPAQRADLLALLAPG
jgi:integrase